jgi:hypothetical protein
MGFQGSGSSSTTYRSFSEGTTAANFISPQTFPVPEPGSALLFVSALTLASQSRRRRI